jgi:prefoldin subunit 2
MELTRVIRWNVCKCPQVLETMNGFDGSRRAYRLIGGVLVEQSVAQIAPAVEKNRIGLERMVNSLSQQLEDRKNAIKAFEEKYSIRAKTQQQSQPSDQHHSSSSQQSQQQSAGVLVSDPAQPAGPDG